MELEPGIHQLTFGKQTSAGIAAPNAFLVCGTDASLLLDTGWDNEADHQARLAYIRDVGAPPLVELVMMHRHPDHAGGALRLHRDTGAPMSCHPLDLDAIEQTQLRGQAKVARLLRGGETMDLGGVSLQVLHTPGHTPRCLAVYVPERGALFTTDTVLGGSTTAIGDNGDLAQYLQSLDTLRGIGAKTIYPGHGELVADPDRYIGALIEHRRHREEQLLDELAQGARTATQIADVLYGGLIPSRRRALADAQVRSGLRKLISEGTVRASDDGYALT